MAISTWQLALTLAIATVGAFLVEGSLHLWPVHARSLLALVFTAALGSAFAYLLWFDVIHRVSATTASLGILSVPVVGVLTSMLVLDERPTTFDVVGFALILAAAGCVLLAPASRASRRT